MIVGYARVSSDSQDYQSQVDALRAAGAARVFAEKMSGKDASNRNGLAKALGSLERGDVLLVTCLDRLARSTRDLLNVMADITDKGAKFKSLADPWCDTSSPMGELIITILGGLATWERHLILARTSAGRARAKANGVRFGRKRKLTEHQRREAIQRKASGETLCAIARSYNVDVSMISRGWSHKGKGALACRAAAASNVRFPANRKSCARPEVYRF
jgi:DNA invertase Pin-like site-specific DNA recombinase